MKVFIQNRTARLVALFFLLTGLIWAFAGPAHAQTQQQPHRGPDQATRQAAADTDANAERVREQSWRDPREVLPALGQILRLDPALMGREDYMAPYPALVAFLDSIRKSSGTPATTCNGMRTTMGLLQRSPLPGLAEHVRDARGVRDRADRAGRSGLDV